MTRFFSDQQQETVSGAARWNDGRGVFFASGAFAGATAGLQASFDGGETWLVLDGAQMDTPGDHAFVLNNVLLRAYLVGGGPETRVTCGVTGG